MKIIGIEKKQGTYEGKEWCHYLVNLAIVEGDFIGSCSTIVKVKHPVMQNLLEESKKTLKDLIGCNAEFYYDQYRNVSKVSLT